MARVIEIDPRAGLRRLFHWQESTEEMTLRTEQNVQPIIDHNQALYADTDARARWRPDMNHVGKIPIGIWQDLLRRGIAQDDAALLRWLDDRDNRVWRVRPGRLS